MSDHAPRALFVAFSNAAAGVEEERFQHWYEDVHRPESFEVGLFHASARYRAQSPSRARFLTLWEADYASEGEALARVRPAAQKMREQGHIWPVNEVVFQHFVFLVRSAPGFALADLPRLTTLQNDWRHPLPLQDPETWWKQAVEAAVPADGLSEACALYASGCAGSDRPGRMLAVVAGAVSAEPDGDAQAGLRLELPPFGEATPVYSNEGAAEVAVPELSASEHALAARRLFGVQWERTSHASLR
ncbi:MAG: hypothetical protein HRU02_11390 [Myxococcales bacterium]|nr:hypothetical protein [Myxococcales bacterium]